MLRESVFRDEYGVIGAGAVAKSLIGQLSVKSRHIGPVGAVSFRVASRIVNSLRAGYPVRTGDEFTGIRAVLVHAPPHLVNAIGEILLRARIDWTACCLIFCDCEAPGAVASDLRERGACVATARRFIAANRLVIAGDAAATQHAHRIAKLVHFRAVEIRQGSADLFDAAITLATGGLTPLVDRAAAWMRDCGIRRAEAVAIATSVFEKTIRDYSHSGRQSWAWHMRAPEPERIEEQLASTDPHLHGLLRQLILLGFEENGKHQEIANKIRNPE